MAVPGSSRWLCVVLALVQGGSGAGLRWFSIFLMLV